MSESRTYDVAVVGLGIVGAATLYTLSKRGIKALGIESANPGQPKGSSTGKCRLFRQAYFEGRDYWPLLRTSYTKWKELNEASGKSLFSEIGFLLMTEKGITGDLATLSDLNLRKLNATEIRKEFPYFKVLDKTEALWEPQAGYLAAERSLDYFINKSVKNGADIRFGERIADAKKVHRDYNVKKVIFATGAWTHLLFGELNLNITIKRAPQIWFPSTEKMAKAPCFAFNRADGFYYGFPNIDDFGVKVAAYDPYDAIPTPESIDSKVSPEMLTPLQTVIKACLPEVKPKMLRSQMCWMALAPNDKFIVDKHPTMADTILWAGESGHAFKFAPVLGEALADLALEGKTAHPIDFLKVPSSSMR